MGLVYRTTFWRRHVILKANIERMSRISPTLVPMHGVGDCRALSGISSEQCAVLVLQGCSWHADHSSAEQAEAY